MPAPRMVIMLNENSTIPGGSDLRTLVRWAREAEDAGFDGVMASEHIVMGPDAGVNGVMGNPRAYALPGNQDVFNEWPNSMVLLGAISSVTSSLRLVASAVLAPLRHPLVLARELGTLDLISEGRLVVQPSVSWSRDEYAALGVPFERRGSILDEQLEVLRVAWGPSPLSYHGEHFDFHDVYFEPKASRPEGPRLWFGGQGVHPALMRRMARYGHGFCPIWPPTDEDLAKLQGAMKAVDRDISELEMIAFVQAEFADETSCADLGQAMATIPEQLERGYTTFCIKPSQFVDDDAEVGAWCREVMRRAEGAA